MSLSKGSMASSHTIIGGAHSAGGGGTGGERVVLLSPSESSKPMPPTAVMTTPTSLAPIVAEPIAAAAAVSLPPSDGEGDGNGVDDIPAPEYHTHSSSSSNGDGSGCVSNDNGAPNSAMNVASAITISNDNIASATTSGRTGGLERLRSSRSSYSFIPPGNLFPHC